MVPAHRGYTLGSPHHERSRRCWPMRGGPRSGGHLEPDAASSAAGRASHRGGEPSWSLICPTAPPWGWVCAGWLQERLALRAMRGGVTAVAAIPRGARTA